MSVLNRKLFNRGGKVSSRGVGITSGLIDQPVQKFQSGGSVSKQEALAPFFADLSGRLLAGRSFDQGIGGALQIGGEALAGSAPLLQQGLATYRAGQKQTDRKIIEDAQGFKRFVDTGERVFPDVEKPLDEPESIAYIKVLDKSEKYSVNKDKLSIFEGWIFASSPALNAMEHPVYDVSLISCKKDKTLSNKSSSLTLKD